MGSSSEWSRQSSLSDSRFLREYQGSKRSIDSHPSRSDHKLREWELDSRCASSSFKSSSAQLDQFDGVWVTNTGVWRTVVLGWLPDYPIRVEGNHFYCNGWAVTEFDQERVVWERNSHPGNTEVIEWRRPDPVALDGPWLSTAGWCNVRGGFIDNEQIILDKGWLRLGNWVAKNVDEISVTWENDGHILVWHRPTPQDLEGPWVTSKGSHRTISQGMLQGKKIDIIGVSVFYQGWELTYATEDELVWNSQGLEAVWKRPDGRSLDGPWYISASCQNLETEDSARTWLNVKFGDIQESPIRKQNGRMTWNGLICSEVGEDVVAWTPPLLGGAQSVQIVWHRPVAKDLEGPWEDEQGRMLHVQDGVVENPWNEDRPSEEAQLYHRLENVGGFVNLSSRQAMAMTWISVTWQEQYQDKVATWNRPTVISISGPWQSLGNSCHNVVDGRLDGHEVLLKQGRLVCADWVVAELHMHQLVWELDGDTVTWKRPNVEVLDGPWLNTEGCWRNVEGGRLPDGTISKHRGRLVYEGWTLTVMTEDSIRWEKLPDQDLPAINWRRPRPTDLDGPWISPQDGWRTVIAGRVQELPIKVDGNHLVFNGWKVTAITDLSIRWERLGKTIEWHRPWRRSRTNDIVPRPPSAPRPSSRQVEAVRRRPVTAERQRDKSSTIRPQRALPPLEVGKHGGVVGKLHGRSGGVRRSAVSGG